MHTFLSVIDLFPTVPGAGAIITKSISLKDEDQDPHWFSGLALGRQLVPAGLVGLWPVACGSGKLIGLPGTEPASLALFIQVSPVVSVPCKIPMSTGMLHFSGARK